MGRKYLPNKQGQTKTSQSPGTARNMPRPDVLYLRAEGLERRDEISNCRIKSQSIIYLPLESKSAKMLNLAQRKPRKILI